MPPTRKPPSREAHSCPTCKKVFSRKEYVRRHQRLKHQESRTLTCKPCDISFASADLLDQHYADEHAIDPDFALRNSPTDEPVPVRAAGRHKNGSGRSAGVSGKAHSPRLPQNMVASGSTAGLSSPDFDDDPHSSSSNDSPLLLPIGLPPTVSHPSSLAHSPLPSTSSSFPPGFGGLSPQETTSATLHGSYHFPAHYTNPLDNHSHLILNAAPASMYAHSHHSPPNPPQTLDGSGKLGDFYLRAKASPAPTSDWIGRETGYGSHSLGGSSDSRSHSQPSNFFPPSQRFYMGLKSPWELPNLPTLSRYASLASSFLLPALPVVHVPTFYEQPITPPFAFALAAAGAGYETDARTFHDESLQAQRQLAIYHPELQQHMSTEEDFSMIACLVIYNFLALFHQNPAQRNLSVAAHDALVKAFRRHDLLGKIQRSSWIMPAANCSGEELERSWRHWVQIETWKRLTFLVFMLDLEQHNHFGFVASFKTSDLASPLPSPAILWTAPNSRAWLALLHNSDPVVSQPPFFLSMLDAMISLEYPPTNPNTNSARLVPHLGEMDTLALSVLSQTLDRLGQQFAGSLETVDPITGGAMASGLAGGFDGRETPGVTLTKVRNAQRLMESMSRSGVDGWDSKSPYFKGLQPIFA